MEEKLLNRFMDLRQCATEILKKIKEQKGILTEEWGYSSYEIIGPLDEVMDRDIFEFLTYAIENNGKKTNTFSDVGLLHLNGCLFIKNKWENCLYSFEETKKNRTEIRKKIFEDCRTYYNNSIQGNPKRKHYLTLKPKPPHSIPEARQDTIKNICSWLPAGLAVFVSVLLGATGVLFKEIIFGLALWSGGLSWVLGRITGSIICAIKNKILFDKRVTVESENNKEWLRWEKEVEKEFNSKIGDFRYFYDNVGNVISKLKEVNAALTVYIEEKFSFMPQKYMFDIKAVSTFSDYLKDKRVTTLQEAVNLYVSETQREEFQAAQLQRQEAILQAQEQLYKESLRKNELLAEQVQQQEHALAYMREIEREIKHNNEIETQKIQELEKLEQEVADAKRTQEEKIRELENLRADVKKKLDL